MPRPEPAVGPALDHEAPTAAVLVGSYGGVGIHTVLNIFRAFPGHFKNLVFVSVGRGRFGRVQGGARPWRSLQQRTEEMLGQYVPLAPRLGVPATSRMAIGTEAVAEAREAMPRPWRGSSRESCSSPGKMIFQRERWYHRLLHNETALAVEKRLRWAGKTMVTLPIRVREAG